MPGDLPSHGDGEVHVVLSKASAVALQHVSLLRRWSVAPPMTRGANAKQAAGGSKKLVAPVPLKPKKFQPRKVNKKRKGETAKPEVVHPAEMDQSWFRRTSAGRENILGQMHEIYELDQKIFSSAPAFSLDGHCRAKFPGADQFTWNQILEASPRTIETMFPAWLSQFVPKHHFH